MSMEFDPRRVIARNKKSRLYEVLTTRQGFENLSFSKSIQVYLESLTPDTCRTYANTLFGGCVKQILMVFLAQDEL